MFALVLRRPATGVAGLLLFLAASVSGQFVHQYRLQNPGQGSYFGESIGIADGYVVVGETGDVTLSPRTGRAFMFDVGTGALVKTLTPPPLAAGVDPDSSEYFGVSQSVSGSLGLFGSPVDATNGSYRGAAYIYDLSSGQSLHKLLSPESGLNEEFGSQVAIDGDRSIVSSFTFDSGPGAVHVFDTSNGTLVGTVFNPHNHTPFTTTRVAVSGDIGVFNVWPQSNSDGSKTIGYLFDAAAATLGVPLEVPDGIEVLSSSQVDANEDYVVITSDSGALIFDSTTGEFLRSLHLPIDLDPGYYMADIAIEGDLALIGVPHHSFDDPYYSGRVYLFDISTGELIEEIIAPGSAINQDFGSLVAFDGETAAVVSIDFSSPARFVDVYRIPEPGIAVLLAAAAVFLPYPMHRERMP